RPHTRCRSPVLQLSPNSATPQEAAMKRSLTTAALAITFTTLSGAGAALAITNGAPDGNGHPNVGGLVAPTAYSDGTWLYCSGTLISPTVFVTAAHCADAESRVRVTCGAAHQEGGKVY